MSPKKDAYLEYDVHGEGVTSLRDGFAQIQMPPERWDEAIEIVTEVLNANGVSQFYWYKPPATNELCGYWDDADVNMIWVSPSDVHVHARTPRPPRATTMQRDEGNLIGWLLPGANSGAGGGPRRAKASKVTCPDTNLDIPAGSECPYCGIEHS